MSYPALVFASVGPKRTVLGLLLVLHKCAADFPLARRAEEIAFFLRPVVIPAFEGAALVSDKGGRPQLPLGETVPMAGEDRLKVVRLESLQQHIGIEWRVLHGWP